MNEEMKNSQMKICLQCDNHCPADALKCGKGRRFFGVEEENHSHRESGSLASLLQRCGRLVHHTDVEEELLFQALTAEEKAALQTLLGKLDTGWRAQFGEEALSHGHHHSHTHDGEPRHRHEGQGK